MVVFLRRFEPRRGCRCFSYSCGPGWSVRVAHRKGTQYGQKRMEAGQTTVEKIWSIPPVVFGQTRVKKGAGQSNKAENTLCRPCFSVYLEMAGKVPGALSYFAISAQNILNSSSSSSSSSSRSSFLGREGGGGRGEGLLLLPCLVCKFYIIRHRNINFKSKIISKRGSMCVCVCVFCVLFVYILYWTQPRNPVMPSSSHSMLSLALILPRGDQR